MGIGLGAAGVLQTSGNTVLMPPLPLWAMPRMLAKVACPMSHLVSVALTARTVRGPLSEEQ